MKATVMYVVSGSQFYCFKKKAKRKIVEIDREWFEQFDVDSMLDKSYRTLMKVEPYDASIRIRTIKVGAKTFVIND